MVNVSVSVDGQALSSIPSDVLITKIIDDESGVQIFLESTLREIFFRVRFKDVYLYQVSDESFRLKSLEKIKKSEVIQVFEKSYYLNYFHSQSFNIYREVKLKHFVVLTRSDYVDVLSINEPDIEIMTAGKARNLD